MSREDSPDAPPLGPTAPPASPPSPAASRQPPAALLSALAELEDLFGEIVRTAEGKASLRCPYMNVKRECTAQFECRNQVFTPRRERAICSGLHRINFSCGGADGKNPHPGGKEGPNESHGAGQSHGG